MREKIIGTICLVLGITIIVTTGTSFAYFTAISDNNNNITGQVEGFGVTLTLDEIYAAEQLIPVEDSKILTAVNKTPNKCKDNQGYDVCSLYKITLNNTGEAQVLNGFVKAKTSEYITDNLKCQLINSDLNETVGNVMTLSKTASEKTYFEVVTGENTNLLSTAINNTPVTYYLAIWLTETHDYQDDDYDRDFTGSIAFESIYGQTITAEFSS